MSWQGQDSKGARKTDGAATVVGAATSNGRVPDLERAAASGRRRVLAGKPFGTIERTSRLRGSFCLRKRAGDIG